jgi:hypothetical protein
MGGGLIQLVAYGAQDVYLTGNPQITFFKVVYRRHTNFAMESIQQTLNGTPGFDKRVTCQISRNGDLIHRVWLELILTATNSGVTDTFCDMVGLRCIKYVELEIGGQRIDKHYPEWMYIWNELSLPEGKQDGYKVLINSTDVDSNSRKKASSSSKNTSVYVPLEFWFCRNVGLALPLIALQYHEVKLNIEFESSDKVKYATAITGANLDAKLWVDYIFLDTDERRRFAQLSHEYLIEQLQFTGDESITAVNSDTRIKLNFNHPCKELIWVCPDPGDSNTWTKFASGSSNCITEAKLQLNGQDRFAARNGDYFNLIQPFQHHERVPSNRGINVYSFALKPEEHQPSGTLNMSRIDTAVLNVKAAEKRTIKVFATNYNVLRIMSGMGGLAYSN